MLLLIFTYRSSSIYFSFVLFLIFYDKRFIKSHVLLQTANLSLYLVTKVSLCLSSIVYYFSKKSIFTPFLSLRIVLCWLFLSAHHLFWEIFNLNLAFAYRGFQRLFLLIWNLTVRGKTATARRKAELFQTVSTVYFILSILTTDLWSVGNDCCKSDSKSLYFAVLATERERHLTTGKRAERTKLDFQYPIWRSAIGQASCLICARCCQLKFPFCC